MFRIEPHIGIGVKKSSVQQSPQESASRKNHEVEARRRSAGEVIARLAQPFSQHDSVSKRDFTLRRSAALLGVAVAVVAPKVGLADSLDTTSKEAAQNMVSDIQHNADPKHVTQLRGVVVLSSTRDDVLKVRPSISTGTFETDDIKGRVAPEQQVAVKNPLLVRDDDDGDTKLIVQTGKDSDNGYGGVAVDYRTNTNIDMSGVEREVIVSLEGLRATNEGTIVGDDILPVGVIRR